MKARLALIGIGASIVLIGAWFFLMWKPASNDLDQAKADKVAAEQKADQLAVRLAHLKNLEANAEVLERDRALLAEAIPSTDLVDQFILQVNERAARSGVQFVSVSPQQPGGAAAAPGAAAGPTSIGLQIQATGDYFQLLRFLEELRDGPRLVTVDTFSLSKGGEGNQMSASVGGRMFLNPTATAAAVPQAPAA
ncbi:MAG TPA: type 4a pilus biogenesis protein PilO [Acidimicrobiales bacterium]|nr:type 4a pilus biogenesis protein PilO [Acidimicrobiales bacterium]